MPSKIYRYVVRYDTGVAPNVDGGVCTLAVCKPAIRSTAREGDIVVGFGPAPFPNRLTYVMQVEHRISFAEFWGNPAHRCKRPGRSATPDNIYRPTGHRYELVPNPAHDESNKVNDLSCEFVLSGSSFWYFGGTGPDLPDSFSELFVAQPRSGHRVSEFDTAFCDRLLDWLGGFGNGVLGRPRDALASGHASSLPDGHGRQQARNCQDDDRGPSAR